MHEVLADSRVEKCAVVEVEEALVGWMRDGTVPHGPALLADERVSVVVADIGVALAEARPAAYDLILLDVDNGPGYLVHESNAVIYEAPFLAERAVGRCGPAARWWCGPPTPRRTSSRPCGPPSTRSRRRRTTCCCRAATSSTGSTSPGVAAA